MKLGTGSQDQGGKDVLRHAHGTGPKPKMCQTEIGRNQKQGESEGGGDGGGCVHLMEWDGRIKTLPTGTRSGGVKDLGGSMSGTRRVT